MYRKIIAGYDLQNGGRDAIALARDIALATGAELIVAGVFPFGKLAHGFESQWNREEGKIAGEIERAAEAAGAQAEAYPSPTPARGLHELAEEIGADLVVVGSSHRGAFGQLIAGNVGLALLQGSPCAVAIAPKGYRESAAGLGPVVVGIDGSPESRLALQSAIDVIRAGEGSLKLVAVAEPPPLVFDGGSGHGYMELADAAEEHLRQHLDEASAEVPADVEFEATLVSGDPAVKLADAARAGGGLLLLGSRSYGPLRRVLVGSVASAVMRSAPCPVIVHPRGAQAPLGREQGETVGSRR